jgi:23S rRNA (adenine2503-C2)-methyltransferase
VADLLKACKDYAEKTGDKVTFEYVLLKGITDQIEHAHQLVKLVRGVPCKINIIPFNEHPGAGYERPADEQIELFHKELMDLGVHVLLRRTMGRDIYAACGQLTSAKPDRPETMDISNSKLAGMSKYKRELAARQAAEGAQNV